MKKLMALMVMLCLWLPLCAFKDVSSGAVLNSSGSVNEIVTIKYTNEDAEKLNLTFNQLHTAVSQISNSIQANLQAKYQSKITNATNITLAQKQTMIEDIKIATTTKIVDENEGQFGLNITYETKSTWNSFCMEAINGIEETTEVSLFLKKFYIKLPIKISSITNNNKEVSLIDYTYKLFSTKLSQELNKDIQPILSQSYSYIYAANLVRFHSNATAVEYDSTTGLTYYLWEFDFGEPMPEITFWQTRANAVTWYCIAVMATLVLGGILFGCAISKKQKKAGKTF